MTSQYIRDEVLEARNTTIQKAGRPRRWQIISQNNRLMGAWILGSFIEQRGEGGEEVK